MKGADTDRRYMALALRLAAKARGRTRPNPMVGAVVVAGRRIVGQGYHRRAGGPHAEILALEAAGRKAQGATLYLTLEPCCHLKKRTPPCVPAILAAGIARVVVAMPDPNPRVGGRGIRALRRAGLTVTVGCLREEAERLNPVYLHWVRRGLPYVTLKAAMTLDGKIATAAGESQWITGTAARRYGHHLRGEADAVLVGLGTILHDDPRLTVRGATRRSPEIPQPLRVVLDAHLRIPLTARVLTRQASRTCIATTALATRKRRELVSSTGASLLILPQEDGRVSLRACLARLARQGISSVLIEGGSEVNASALRSGLVNRGVFVIAPKLLGGQDAKGAVGGRSPRRLAQAMAVTDLQVRRLGDDLVVAGTIRPPGSSSRSR